ncbi:DEAD/DEAH box helicase [Fibrella forsythiae]|uniref:DEAD/DEAH box helicase n=1 Tax=Fibrella forsythiae TaxID=2817061 RepID=A0ABS3JUR7_9BACT|nr:DEAD/DEAH box helicase [Fibrella forsythiae]MBO0953116.1 DEAD/DEAH box helicase [Fibrella forsythiae]
MNSVLIDIDENKQAFLLIDVDNLILKNYRAKSYFKSFLNAEINTKGDFSIPFQELEKEIILNKIQDALQKYSIKYTDSENIVSILSIFYESKNSFNIFSEKAKGIWNNIVDLHDFDLFKKSVELRLLNRRLYDKQLLAAFHLAFSQNACNFSVPGAGKTSVVYGAYSHLNSLPEDNNKFVNKLLIIGPLSSFGPWENEYEECFGRKCNSIRLSGGIDKAERERHLLSSAPISETPELTLMSYQSVPSNLDNLKYFLQRKGNRVMVVLDEAHKIKNTEGGLWAQSILSLSKYCKARVVLTGTPAPNGYEDMFNIFDFIWPNKNIINFNTAQLKEMSSNPFDIRVDKLIDDIAPYFIRIRKRDLNLPPAVNKTPLLVEMGHVQREIYEFIEGKYLSYFSDSEIATALTSELTKARLIRLMQAATNPNLLKQPLDNYFLEQGLTNDLYIDDSEVIKKILNYRNLEPIPKKFEKVKDLVHSLITKNEKVIIWGTFIQNIKGLQEYLFQNGINSKLLIGETPVENNGNNIAETRESIIRDFHKEDSDFNVIIANPFAVSESISLHKACHNAIYFERTFNAANYIQSKDRIHRVGLLPEVITSYYYILSKDTIDEVIDQRLRVKEERMNELLESQEIPLIVQNSDFDFDFDNDLKAMIRSYVRRTSKI